MKDEGGRSPPRIRGNFGDPLGPWTHQHTVGASFVVLIFLALAANIWPGCDFIAGMLD